MEKKALRSILVVDDTRLIRIFLKDLLANYDLRPVFAVNGQEAIGKWEQEEFGVIFMDIEMPVMDGLEATRIIRAREKKEKKRYTPIVGFSGATGLDVRKDCLSVGMDAFLAKPLDIQDTLDQVFTYI